MNKQLKATMERYKNRRAAKAKRDRKLARLYRLFLKRIAEENSKRRVYYHKRRKAFLAQARRNRRAA